MLTTIEAEDILSIVHSNHQNPHFILGCHKVSVPDNNDKVIDAISIRTFLPDAKEIYIIKRKTPEKKIKMYKVHNHGLFEAILWDEKEKLDYYFEVHGYIDNTWTLEDPYSEFVENITDFDKYLFNRSQHYNLYEKLGAHPFEKNGKKGIYFSVWAPNAQRVSLIGDFNGWDGRKDQMNLLSDSGMWVLFKPGMKEGEKYKYEIKAKDGRLLEKADPYAFYSEQRPKTASIVYDFKDYKWKDKKWIDKRAKSDFLNQPISIYEVHLGSWRKKMEDENRPLTYIELADDLIPYTKEMGFTHIELMPIEEHPFDGSWGYQVTGYFAPTSRFGEPKDLQIFIDRCHKENIGVILDWVPGHFPKDPHGLIEFDGTALYEHADPRQGEHMDWGTKIFNYGRFEVKNFLISNALYWIDKFHFDGLRVDAVASMLYLDYSREDNQWIPNKFGGRENLEAIEFMQHLNSVIYQLYPGVLMMGEESTSYQGVSKPTYLGGLGFGFKWNMGWMNDTLEYITKDPIHRKYHHGELTFSFLYAWSENFVLPISHDEVVHGKGSMISKMPGDYWQRFANLRSFYTYMWAHPGKQLLFMGQEFAQFDEWNFEKSLDWHLLNFDFHKGIQYCIKDLNKIYKEEKALWELDFTPDGFQGINCDDSENSVLSFIRRSSDPKDFLVIAVNFTPVPREKYTLIVPEDCFYEEIFNSDSSKYMGSNTGNMGGVKAMNDSENPDVNYIQITIPPLAGIILKPIYPQK